MLKELPAGAGIDAVNAGTENADAPAHAVQRRRVRHAVDALGHAGNHGYAAGGQAARHVCGHFQSMGTGAARTHHGNGGSAEQRGITTAVEEGRGVGEFAKQWGKGGVGPQEDGGIKGAGGIPFPARFRAPGPGGKFSGHAPVHSGPAPCFGRADGRIRGTESPEQARAGTRPDAPAMAQRERGPVFGPRRIPQP